MYSIECSNNDCGQDIPVDFQSLEWESEGESGTYSTAYVLSGLVTCPDCNTIREVEYLLDVCDDTGEILSVDRL